MYVSAYTGTKLQYVACYSEQLKISARQYCTYSIRYSIRYTILYRYTV